MYSQNFPRGYSNQKIFHISHLPVLKKNAHCPSLVKTARPPDAKNVKSPDRPRTGKKKTGPPEDR